MNGDELGARPLGTPNDKPFPYPISHAQTLLYRLPRTACEGSSGNTAVHQESQEQEISNVRSTELSHINKINISQCQEVHRLNMAKNTEPAILYLASQPCNVSDMDGMDRYRENVDNHTIATNSSSVVTSSSSIVDNYREHLTGVDEQFSSNSKNYLAQHASTPRGALKETIGGKSVHHMNCMENNTMRIPYYAQHYPNLGNQVSQVSNLPDEINSSVTLQNLQKLPSTVKKYVLQDPLTGKLFLYESTNVDNNCQRSCIQGNKNISFEKQNLTNAEYRICENLHERKFPPDGGNCSVKHPSILANSQDVEFSPQGSTQALSSKGKCPESDIQNRSTKVQISQNNSNMSFKSSMIKPCLPTYKECATVDMSTIEAPVLERLNVANDITQGNDPARMEENILTTIQNSPNADKLPSVLIMQEKLKDTLKNLSTYFSETEKINSEISETYVKLHETINKLQNQINNCESGKKDVATFTLNDGSATKNEVYSEQEVNDYNYNDDKDHTNDDGSSTSDEDYCQKKSRDFFKRVNTRPPNYDPGDSRWTLKHKHAVPGVVELVPGSGVLISKKRLRYCKRGADDCNELARMLMCEIFTPRALRTCSLTGQTPLPLTKKDIKPGLDQLTIAVILEFVEKYGLKKHWNVPDSKVIEKSMYNKLFRIRRAYRSNK